MAESDDFIRVLIRVRPFNEREKRLGCKCVVTMTEKTTTIQQEGRETRSFGFDRCFWSFNSVDRQYASQKLVFSEAGEGLVRSMFSGFNASLFAYGQTGSGKTYSLFGYDGEDAGVIPRFVESVFQHLEQQQEGKKKSSQTSFRLEGSMLEIYQETVRDLFGHSHSLKIRENPKTGPYVEGLTWWSCSSLEEVMARLDQGFGARTVASTEMNDASSRSHAIFQLRLTQVETTDLGDGSLKETEKKSVISLVDLAGSERFSMKTQTDRMTEGRAINKSLSALIGCIQALERASKTEGVHVPYRDSKLTHLLKESLGGNAKTAMLVTVSPADANIEETLSSLKYATLAKGVQTRAVVNEDEQIKLIRQLRTEIAELKRALQSRAAAEAAMGGGFGAAAAGPIGGQFLSNLTAGLGGGGGSNNSIGGSPVSLSSSSATPSSAADSHRLPQLVSLNTEQEDGECLVYFLRPGKTLVENADEEGGSGAATPASSTSSSSGADKKVLDESDIIDRILLRGLDISKKHAVIVHSAATRTVHLLPLSSAPTYINGERVTQQVQLTHRMRIAFGFEHIYRFHDPEEAAASRKRREEFNRAHPGMPPLRPVVIDYEKALEEIQYGKKMIDDDEALMMKQMEQKHQQKQQQQGQVAPVISSSTPSSSASSTPTGQQQQQQQVVAEKKKVVIVRGGGIATITTASSSGSETGSTTSNIIKGRKEENRDSDDDEEGESESEGETESEEEEEEESSEESEAESESDDDEDEEGKKKEGVTAASAGAATTSSSGGMFFGSIFGSSKGGGDDDGNTSLNSSNNNSLLDSSRFSSGKGGKRGSGAFSLLPLNDPNSSPERNGAAATTTTTTTDATVEGSGGGGKRGSIVLGSIFGGFGGGGGGNVETPLSAKGLQGSIFGASGSGLWGSQILKDETKDDRDSDEEERKNGYKEDNEEDEDTDWEREKWNKRKSSLIKGKQQQQQQAEEEDDEEDGKTIVTKDTKELCRVMKLGGPALDSGELAARCAVGIEADWSGELEDVVDSLVTIRLLERGGDEDSLREINILLQTIMEKILGEGGVPYVSQSTDKGEIHSFQVGHLLHFLTNLLTHSSLVSLFPTSSPPCILLSPPSFLAQNVLAQLIVLGVFSMPPLPPPSSGAASNDASSLLPSSLSFDHYLRLNVGPQETDIFSLFLSASSTSRGAVTIAEGMVRRLCACVAFGQIRQFDVRSSASYAAFQQSTADLQAVDVMRLSFNDSQTFFVNVFNCLCLHAHLTVALAENTNFKHGHSVFMKGAQYRIGEVNYSLEDILNCLRGKAVKRFAPAGKVSSHGGGGGIVDPRIHFAICDFTASSPPLRIYTAENFANELEMAAERYLQREVSLRQESSGPPIVFLPRVFKTFAKDFGEKNSKIMDFVSRYVDPETSHKLKMMAHGQAKYTIKYSDFDWRLTIGRHMGEFIDAMAAL